MINVRNMKNEVVTVIEDYGDDITGFKKGQKFYPMMVYTTRQGKRVYKILTANGVYANVPVEIFTTPVNKDFADNPLFGSF